MYKVYPLIQIRQEEKIVNKITGVNQGWGRLSSKKPLIKHYNIDPLTHWVCIAPCFIILLCLMPDNFTRQGKGAGT
jgi:hypothetical protein